MHEEPPATPLRAKQRPTREAARSRPYSLRDVARHRAKDDGWIAVDGIVYDITNFAKNHPGWTEGGMTSTALAIERALGTDCTEEFHELHTPGQLRTLQTFAIGRLVEEPAEAPRATSVDELPEVLLHRVCCFLETLGGAAAAGGGLGRHARAYGDEIRGRRTFVSLPCTTRRDLCTVDAVPGLNVDGRVVTARPRWMCAHRVLDLGPVLTDAHLFEVDILEMKSLTLEVGVAAFVGGQCLEWFVDGAGRAVHKARYEDSERVAFAYGPRLGAGRRVGVFRRGAALWFCVDGHAVGEAFQCPRSARAFLRFPPAPGPLDGRLVVQQFGPELDDWLSLKVAPATTVRTLRRIVACVLTSRSQRRQSGGAPAAPGDLDVHLLPAIFDVPYRLNVAIGAEVPDAPATPRRPGAPGAKKRDPRSGLAAAHADAAAARYGVITEKHLDRPLADFGLRFLANGIQSRPVFVNLVRDIS